MSKHSWQVAMVALTAGLGLTPSSAHSDDPNPIIAIEVDDRTGSFTARLPRAKSIASDIYRQAGVALQWSAGDETVVDRTLTVVITDSTSMSGRFAPGAMGVAPSPGDGTRGTLAYVFRDRVMAFADAHRLAHAYVLAAALAHEIGHLLLPPNAHAPDGIMRGSWDPALFPPRVPGVPGFSPPEARLLRRRARGPTAAPPVAAVSCACAVLDSATP